MAATLAACHAVFHPGRDGGASGRGEPASGRSAGAVGGLACAPPRVGALSPERRPLPFFPPGLFGIKPPTPPAVEVCLEDPSPAVLLLVAGTALGDFQFRYLSSSTRANVQKRRGH